jgi:DUF1680 family protein
VAPSPAAISAVRPLPLGAVRLTGGLWADRQHVNRSRSIEHVMLRLVESGNFENFRRIADGARGPHGHASATDAIAKNFVDTDVYKWLEAVGWEGSRGSLSAAVEGQADEAIELIGRAQDADGYINTWYQTLDPSLRFTNMAFGHELYCLGHLIQAGLAYHRARGDARLLRIAQRFADLAVGSFGAGQREYVCGHPEVEMALVELGRETGDGRYVELGKLLLDRRGRGLLGPSPYGTGYFQDRRPYRELPGVEGHAVRAVYLGCGAVDVSTELRDPELLAASRRQWSDMVASKMYITGAVGSRHHGEAFGEPFELPPDRAYGETCASLGAVMWSWRLLLTELNATYGDVLERVLLNAVFGSTSPDGTSFHYTNPLLVRSAHDRQPWFEVACCPPNLLRTIATIEQYVATESDAGLQIHQYASSRIEATGGQVVTVETGYPFQGSIRVKVDRTAGEWALSMRIPAWAREARLRVNGEGVDAITDNGYAAITRRWAAGDELILDLEMGVRVTRPAWSIDALAGQIAVERGPLVYCAEQCDSPLPLTSPIAIDVTHLEHDDDAPGEPAITVTAVGLQDEPNAVTWPYFDRPLHPPVWPDQRPIRLIPYHRWGNRGSGPMRVWLHGQQAN